MLKRLVYWLTGFCMHSWETTRTIREADLYNSENPDGRPIGMRMYYADKCRICGKERIRMSEVF